jgi:hypothetical protein
MTETKFGRSRGAKSPELSKVRLDISDLIKQIVHSLYFLSRLFWD